MATNTINTESSPRSVSFNPRTRVVPHIHLSDMTPEEIRSSFISQEDKAAIQRDLVEDIQAMRDIGVSTGTDNDIAHCSRGLEVFESAASVETAKANKLRTLDAVMDEQDRQDDEGFYDENLLAEASIEASQRSVDIAVMRGASDEICVRLQVPSALSHNMDLCASRSHRRRFSDVFQKSQSLSVLPSKKERSSSIIEPITR